MAGAEKQYTAAAVADALEVQASTLRKYAGILEAAGYTFDKDGQGRRLYGAMDLKAFEKLIALNRDGAMSLNDSARAVYHWSKNPNIAPGDTAGVAIQRRDEAEESMAPGDTGRLLSMLENQQKTIEAMKALMERQAEEMAALRGAMSHLIEQQAKGDQAARDALERISATREPVAALPEPEPVQEQPPDRQTATEETAADLPEPDAAEEPEERQAAIQEPPERRRGLLARLFRR